jgi:hypothetical protein
VAGELELLEVVAPGWLAAVSASAAAAFQGISLGRIDSARKWAQHFEELVDFTPEEVLPGSPEDAIAAEVVDEAFVAGARAVDDRHIAARSPENGP